MVISDVLGDCLAPGAGMDFWTEEEHARALDTIAKQPQPYDWLLLLFIIIIIIII